LITATLYVAAVARRPGEPLVIEEIMVAPPMPREVRIRIICSSICHIDLAFSDMQVSLFILHCLSKADQNVFHQLINE